MDQTSTPDNETFMDVKNEANCGPKESTLEFLRIFARLYTPEPTDALSLSMLN